MITDVLLMIAQYVVCIIQCSLGLLLCQECPIITIYMLIQGGVYMGYTINYDVAIAGGVYDDRMLQKNRQTYNDTPTLEQQQEADAAVKALQEKLKGVTVTISPEAVEFMNSMQERKEAACAENERILQENAFLNPDNAFDRIGTQFSVFSGALSEMGFFDELSDEETLKVEHFLASVTYGMNNLRHGGSLKEERPLSEELSSHAARFELESSTAALRQFSEKFIPASMRDSFNDLVDQYYEHNAKNLEGYRSVKEYMNEGSAKIYDRTAFMRAIPLSQDEKSVWKLGKVKLEESDYADAAENWKSQFKMLVRGEKSLEDVFAMMQDTLNALASGNSKNQDVLQYVSQWNASSIENTREYWSMLV